MALPNLELKVPPKKLHALAGRLTSLGYTESAVAALLGHWDLSQIDAEELPNYVWRCRQDGSDLAHLTMLFLLGEGLSKEKAGELLGRDLLSTLSVCGVLFRRSGCFFSHVVLYPCLNHYFFTDYWVTNGQEKGQVYELGTDSYTLARLTPRLGNERALDLCTGSGVHAILSASGCCESTCLDINPRALQYAEFNAALNGVEVKRFLSDLYSEVSDEVYDLITANPPFVPSPDPQVLVHRSAGETGEEVPERLVAGLPRHLADGGLFSMILEYPVLENEDYLDRLQRWLGEDTGWGIAVLSFGEKTVGKYIKKHMGFADDYNAKFERYLESYRSHGIVAIDFANVFIRRERPGRPNWRLKQKTLWPNTAINDLVLLWLQSLSEYLDPEWAPNPDWQPTLGRYYKSLWRDWDLTRGLLESVDDNWLPPDRLNSDEAELLSHMRGERSVKELKNQWLQSGKTEEAFLEAFRGLGVRFAVQ